MKVGDRVVTAARSLRPFDPPPVALPLYTYDIRVVGRRQRAAGVITASHHVRDVYDVQHGDGTIAAYYGDELTIELPPKLTGEA